MDNSPPLLQLPNGTERYPGNMQFPMTPEDQKRAGLIAHSNKSIHPTKRKAV